MDSCRVQKSGLPRGCRTEMPNIGWVGGGSGWTPKKKDCDLSQIGAILGRRLRKRAC